MITDGFLAARTEIFCAYRAYEDDKG